MSATAYNRGKYLALTGAITTSADLRVLLVAPGYTFNPDHNFVSEVSAYELTGAGYSRQALANKSVTEDDAGDFAYLDADDASWASIASGETIGGAIVYLYNASDAAAQLLSFYDLADQTTNGGAVQVRWAIPANGGVLKAA